MGKRSALPDCAKMGLVVYCGYDKAAELFKSTCDKIQVGNWWDVTMGFVVKADNHNRKSGQTFALIDPLL